MKPKISIITLGVSDLEKSVKFYRDGLGLPYAKKNSSKDIAFFELEGTWVSLFPKEKLADDATVSADGSGFLGFTLAHNVSSPEEVDKVLEHAKSIGAKIIKPGQKVFWGGYSGYFSDPDGYLWEVAHNPFMDLT